MSHELFSGRGTRQAAQGRGVPAGGREAATQRIAFFTGNYGHVVDGVFLTLRRLVAHLRRNGHQVLIFGPSGRPHDSNTDAGYVSVPSLPIPGRSEYRLSSSLHRSVQRRLEAFNPTVVHVATPDLLGLTAIRWAKRNAVPVVATYHTHYVAYFAYYHLGFLKGAVTWYTRWFYNQCDHVYVPTEPLIDFFRSIGVRDNVRVWGRGVDQQRFSPDRRSAPLCP